MSSHRHPIGWIEAAPLAAIRVAFLVAPIVMIVIVRFWAATASPTRR